jgi:hypothetical protein
MDIQQVTEFLKFLSELPERMNRLEEKVDNQAENVAENLDYDRLAQEVKDYLDLDSAIDDYINNNFDISNWESEIQGMFTSHTHTFTVAVEGTTDESE